MKIIGATVGTTIPKPNFEQTDPKKGDYIFGDIVAAIPTDVTLTHEGQVADAKAVGDALAEKQPIGDYALKSEIPQSDWNENDTTSPAYIQNRTHYEATPSFDITWDGVIGDRFALDMSQFGFDGIYFVKIDDRVFSLEELVGSTIYDYYGVPQQDKIKINAEDCDAYHYPGLYDIRNYAIVVYDAEQLNTALGLPEGTIVNGTYFYTRPEDGMYVTRFVGRDNSKKLDTKYLPDGYPYESEPKFNIIWNGDMTGRTMLDMTALGYEGFYFVKVSDMVLSKEDVIGSSYAFNWNFNIARDDVPEYIINDTYPGTYDIYNEIVVVYDQDTINATFGLPEGYLTNGVYFVASPTNQHYIARFTGKTEIKKIDGKYVDLDEMGFATVAKSGNYNDLSNKPLIYTDVVRYTSNQGLSSTYKYNARQNIDVYSKYEVDDKIANVDVDLSEYAKTSDLSEYAKTSYTYTKSEVDDKVANIFPRDSIQLIDQVTGKRYSICVRNGVITTYDSLLYDLTDYEYTANDDGTYTITSWNGTNNGEPSTEIIIPNDSNVCI